MDWEVAPLPVITGDGDTLRQALRILVENALKFTRTRATSRVRVWAQERPGEWAVFVQDNGVGFDPRYTDRLFGIVQRLHRQEEFEGAGVGLANVRRIVARHGLSRVHRSHDRAAPPSGWGTSGWRARTLVWVHGHA